MRFSLFIRKDVLVELDGIEFAIGQVVILLGLGAIFVPLVFLDTNRSVSVVVFHFLDDLAGDVVVLVRHTAFLAIGSVLDLLDAASFAIIYFQVV